MLVKEWLVASGQAGMCLDKRTYRTVRRHATSEDTPARIKTNLPNPEPVPALPGSLCSAIVVIACQVDMAVRSAVATAAVVSRRRLLLLHLPGFLSSQAPVRCPAGYVQISAGGVVISEQKTRPLCHQGSPIPAVLFHTSHLEQWRQTALQGPRPTLIGVTRHATPRHNHASSASCDACMH